MKKQKNTAIDIKIVALSSIILVITTLAIITFMLGQLGFFTLTIWTTACTLFNTSAMIVFASLLIGLLAGIKCKNNIFLNTTIASLLASIFLIFIVTNMDPDAVIFIQFMKILFLPVLIGTFVAFMIKKSKSSKRNLFITAFIIITILICIKLNVFNSFIKNCDDSYASLNPAVQY